MPKFHDFVARSLLTVLLLAVTTIGARADADSDRLAVLQAKFRCLIFDYLEAIHRFPTPERLDNRFLIITILNRGDQRYYAQCAFDSLDTRMICELNSPYPNPVMQPYFAGDKLKLVTSLGYIPRPTDNYFQWRDARTPQARYEIAGLLVETVGRVFDMQTDENLMYEAPLVMGTPPDMATTEQFCGGEINLR